MRGLAHIDARWLLMGALALGMTACKSSPMAQVQPAPNSPVPVAKASGRTPALPTGISVPAGTPVSVRLQQPLSSETARAGQTFPAVLDDPLVADGVTLAPKGTAVTGRVLAVRRSGMIHSGGVLQLALDSFNFANGTVAVQTSSVIAGLRTEPRLPQSDAAPYQKGSRVTVGAQRRLTFRLRQAVLLPSTGLERTPAS